MDAESPLPADKDAEIERLKHEIRLLKAELEVRRAMR
jgi:hypothetical protein